MNETKEKIQAMMEQETAEKRRLEMQERQGKKAKKKEKKEHSSIAVEKKNFLRSFVVVLFMLGIAFALFYGASIAKNSAQQDYQKTLKNNAKDVLSNIEQPLKQLLAEKIELLENTLGNVAAIKDFNDPNWQKIIKTELDARLGNASSITMIAANFDNDEIIDDPQLSYGILSLLDELKQSLSAATQHIKIEIHHFNQKNGQLVLIKAVLFRDAQTHKNILRGYILLKLPQQVLAAINKHFNASDGYMELIQPAAGSSLVIIKKGDVSLKAMPLMFSSAINSTSWRLKFWPAAQQDEPPVESLWQAIVYLALGSFTLVVAIILLLVAIKKIRTKADIVIPQRQASTKPSLASSHDSENIMRSKNITNTIYRKDNGIVVEEQDDYLAEIAERIFRAYDIRGVVGEFINIEVFQQIAYALAKEMSVLQQSNISIAYDGRNSSPELVKVVIDALLESGINVLDIGMVTSPILYFSAITKTDGNGLIVTASHNPANYNGLKIMLAGHSYSDKRLQGLKKRLIEGERISGQGQLTQENVLESYMTKITGNVILARPMNIIIDSGNGVTGKFATTFFEQLGCKVFALNSEVDGDFPAHDPDPSRPENMSELVEKVLEKRADLGIAFDGDGDRIGLVSSGGEIIWPDRILMLLARDILSRNKEATILYDVKSSWKLDAFISELGGTAIMCKSGHSFMKSKLQETKALLAGEMSGHIFIKERWFGFDDAMFVAARVLEILSIDLRKSRQIFAELPDSLNTPEILIASTDAHSVMQKMMVDTSRFADGKLITIDGIRVEYTDGWGLVRASNTSDNLTLRFEAENEAALQRIAGTFKEAILAIDPELTFPF